MQVCAAGISSPGDLEKGPNARQKMTYSVTLTFTLQLRPSLSVESGFSRTHSIS